jgi:hypothetical protein
VATGRTSSRIRRRKKQKKRKRKKRRERRKRRKRRKRSRRKEGRRNRRRREVELRQSEFWENNCSKGTCLLHIFFWEHEANSAGLIFCNVRRTTNKPE